MTIREAAAALRSRQVSCLELTNRCLDQIAKVNPRLNAFLTVTEEAARKRASELDSDLANGIHHGPLHGIPIAHKDLIWTRGVRTTSGSKLFADYVPASDAPVVEKLNRAGAVMPAKPACMKLPTGSRPRILTSASFGTRAIWSVRRVDRAEARAPQSPRAWHSWPLERTPVDRFAFPRPSAA